MNASTLRAFVLLIPTTLLGCAQATVSGDSHSGTLGVSAGDSSTSDASESGDEDSAGTSSMTGDGDGDGESELSLSVAVADGACADLSIEDREGWAVRFLASGPPNTSIELYASKAACAVEPFLYQTIELDGEGLGAYEIVHPGSSECSENLLGNWEVWLDDGASSSNTVALAFSNALCPGAASCEQAASYCPDPSPLPPLIPKHELFVLSDAERPIFDPPDPGWVEFGMAFEDYPLQNLWNAFDQGQYVAPLDPAAGPNSWYQLDGIGSQNHSLLWLGVAALGHGLADDVANFELSAQRCLEVLELDAQQGHMRHEAVGQYAGFWQGGIATMALAALYAPEGSSSGPELLEVARAWWADHVAVMRALALPDGQVALIGARLSGAAGSEDSWVSLSAAINLQLIDPRPHGELHPTISQFLSPQGEPLPVDSGVPVRWYRGPHVSERWVVLRAIQSGALLPVPANHPAPPMVQAIYRWTEGQVTHTAIGGAGITGYRPARWHVSWTPGGVLTVVVGDDYGVNSGKGPHQPPQPVVIPPGAELILGG